MKKCLYAFVTVVEKTWCVFMLLLVMRIVFDLIVGFVSPMQTFNCGVGGGCYPTGHECKSLSELVAARTGTRVRLKALGFT